MLHEHETALSAASHANRSRRLIKCAKESARYQRVAHTAAATASAVVKSKFAENHPIDWAIKLDYYQSLFFRELF
jgi:hypothetical protein